ncbi:protein TORNADO 2-like [Vicia villosa]|uniref:protein TORNADO 2-like n=1 Tax=Vicia villosa TaxID=3911 RepID=UPI00273C4B20|nr:protein TORNADO 2-like [Vicia villosa]
MALSNNVIGIINFIAVLLSIPIIGAGIWLTTLQAESCVKILQWPVIILGILIFIVAMVGLVGAFWRIPMLLIFYLIAMIVLIVLLASLVIFVYFVTLRGHGNIEPNRSYLEYRVDDFSIWLRRRVRSSHKWDGVKSCLSSSSICAELNQSYRLPQDFFNAHLSPLQSGCCKPPTKCGYTFVNPTYWISPTNNGEDMDCMKWSNDQTQLCYNCDSCKAGLLATLRKDWRKANVILIVTLVGLIVVYLFGIFAFRNAKTEELFRKYKQGYT